MKIVVVGVGKYAKAVHIPYVQGSKHANLVGTVDRDPDMKLSTYGVPHSYDTTSLNSFIQARDADGVIISTPPDKRQQIYEELFGRPYHLHIDKPFLAQKPGQSMASFLSDYKTYQEKASNHSLPITIHSQRRHDAYIERCKEALDTTKQKTGVLPHYTYYRGVDGNFRTNKEWETENYHDLSTKIGILAHSFYHYIDTYTYLIQDLGSVKTLTTTIQPTYLKDIREQNNLCANHLLNKTDHGSTSGPLAVTIQYTITTQSDTTLTFHIRLSHLGMTQRTNHIANHYTQNRFSQKHLEIQAGSLLTAQTTSQPVNHKQPTQKEDTLTINSRTSTSTKQTRQRHNKLDYKRRDCLASFIKTFTEGTRSRNTFSNHSLTHRFFKAACDQLKYT